MLNGGQGTLDLTQLAVPAGQTVDIDVDVRAGQAAVIVPADANVTSSCSANAGEVDCLGGCESGWKSEGHRDRDRLQRPGNHQPGRCTSAPDMRRCAMADSTARAG